MRTTISLASLMSVFLATGCASYKTTLTDEQGRSVTCEASGKSGIITGYYLKQGFDDCVAAARAKGYTKE